MLGVYEALETVASCNLENLGSQQDTQGPRGVWICSRGRKDSASNPQIPQMWGKLGWDSLDQEKENNKDEEKCGQGKTLLHPFLTLSGLFYKRICRVTRIQGVWIIKGPCSHARDGTKSRSPETPEWGQSTIIFNSLYQKSKSRTWSSVLRGCCQQMNKSSWHDSMQAQGTKKPHRRWIFWSYWTRREGRRREMNKNHVANAPDCFSLILKSTRILKIWWR